MNHYYHLFIVCILSLIKFQLNAQILSYIGPSLCPANTKLLGYLNIATLNNDIEYISQVQKSNSSSSSFSSTNTHLFILCPSTIFDLELSNKNDYSPPITIKSNGTIIQCGTIGTQSEKCIIEGGTTQLLVPFGVRIRNVEVKGLTFTRSTNVNVQAHGAYGSHISFYDCVFKSNTGSLIFKIATNLEERRKLLTRVENSRNLQVFDSMKISIHSSLFQDNYLNHAAILTKGGEAEIHTTTFLRNTVGLYVIGALNNADLYLHYNTTFINNFSPYYTVFTDTYSSLKLNHATINSTNTAESSCSNGVYQQSLADDSIVSPNCFEKQSDCTGNCCRFGNVTCSDEEIQKNNIHLNSDTLNNPFDYTGPQKCSSNNAVIGYQKLIPLIQDMFYDKAEADILAKKGLLDKSQKYQYVLCPKTTFNMDENVSVKNLTKDYFINSIIPLLDNTFIQCGNDGKSTNECIVTGGTVQILFLRGIQVQNVHIKGLTFTSNTKFNIAAWGTFDSSGNFHDCIFRSNPAHFVVHMTIDGEENEEISDIGIGNTRRGRKLRLQQELLREMDSLQSQFLIRFLEQNHAQDRRELSLPTSAMRVSMYSCQFLSNTVYHSLIYDHGGILQLFDTKFSHNVVGVFAVGGLNGANLYLHSDTLFQHTTSASFTVFVDKKSFLKLNDVNSPSNDALNQAPICANGMFIELENGIYSSANCLNKDRSCNGSCCDFGDSSSCTSFTYDPKSSSGKDSSALDGIFSSSGEKDDTSAFDDDKDANSFSQEGDEACGPSCLAAVIIVPLVIIALFIAAITRVEDLSSSEEELYFEESEHQVI